MMLKVCFMYTLSLALWSLWGLFDYPVISFLLSFNPEVMYSGLPRRPFPSNYSFSPSRSRPAAANTQQTQAEHYLLYLHHKGWGGLNQGTFRSSVSPNWAILASANIQSRQPVILRHVRPDKFTALFTGPEFVDQHWSVIRNSLQMFKSLSPPEVYLYWDTPPSNCIQVFQSFPRPQVC